MISDSMFHYLSRLYKCTSIDSFVHVIIDWIVLGCYTGFRKSEWCSDHQDSFDTINDPNWGDHTMALPVIAKDFGSSTKTSHRIRDLTSTPDDTIMFTSLCIRKQKNNDNGHMLMYRHHTDSSWMCPTQAGLNIIRWVNHLDTLHDHPVAVYHDPPNELHHQIMSNQVMAFLWHVAHKVFNIPAGHKDLLVWPCHSIHITAANLLD